MTSARILVKIGDAISFPTAGHLAANAGLDPWSPDPPGRRSKVSTLPVAITND